MKILASDFDSTIYFPDDLEQNQKNVDAINRFIKNGNIFCVITGRNYSSLKPFLVNHKIFYSYLICEDGAKLFNNMDYSIDTTLLDRESIEKIVPVLEENHCDYYLDDGYNETMNYDDCVKIVVNCINEEDKEKIIELVKNVCDVHIYASRYHVNIIHKSVNKKNALEKLFQLENLDLSKLYVIGDNDNDYEMLKAFHGGVMKRHHKVLDELKKKEYNSLSDYIEELMKN